MAKLPKPIPTEPETKTEAPSWNHGPTRNRALVAGFLGAAGSGLVKPLRDLPNYHDLFDGEHGTVIIGALVMGVIGLITVWLFTEYDVKKALTMGLGMPALLVNIGMSTGKDGGAAASPPAGAPPPQIERIEAELSSETVRGALGWLSIFAPTTAYAQPPAAAPTSSVAKVSIELNTNQLVSYEVDVLDMNKQTISSFSVAAEKSKFIGKPLPVGATYLRFKSAGITSDEYKIDLKPGDSTVGVDITVSTKREVGFLQVFGKRAEGVSVLGISISSRPKPPVGTEGWVFLGSWQNGQWNTSYVKGGWSGLPTAGSEADVTFPLNIRAAAGPATGAPLGILSFGQRIRLIEIRAPVGTGPVWARMSVSS